MNPIIFLDFDGVIRIATNSTGTNADFCQERMSLVAKIANRSNAKIVITSDWRHMEEQASIRAFLTPHLHHLLHEDWATPVCGHRWNEVERWLGHHPEVNSYAILEDFLPHFDGCTKAMSERIILCSNRHGFVGTLTTLTLDTLNTPIK